MYLARAFSSLLTSSTVPVFPLMSLRKDCERVAGVACVWIGEGNICLKREWWWVASDGVVAVLPLLFFLLSLVRVDQIRWDSISKSLGWTDSMGHQVKNQLEVLGWTDSMGPQVKSRLPFFFFLSSSVVVVRVDQLDEIFYFKMAWIDYFDGTSSAEPPGMLVRWDIKRSTAAIDSMTSG